MHLFASVIQGLDSQHLRIHDTTIGRLRCDHALEPKAALTCLDWGYYGHAIWERENHATKKKRKRSERASRNGSELEIDSVSLAFGTGNSEIEFYSISEAKVVGRLRDGHTQGIRGFKYVQDGLTGRGWSIGGDSKLVQWDLKSSQSLR